MFPQISKISQKYDETYEFGTKIIIKVIFLYDPSGTTVLPAVSSSMSMEIQDTGCRIQDTGFRTQDTVYSIKDTGYRTQDVGYRIQDM